MKKTKSFSSFYLEDKLINKLNSTHTYENVKYTVIDFDFNHMPSYFDMNLIANEEITDKNITTSWNKIVMSKRYIIEEYNRISDTHYRVRFSKNINKHVELRKI